MKIFENIDDAEDLIKDAINEYGYTPDHNFEWLKYCDENCKSGVAMWDNGYTIWFNRNENTNEYTTISDPIAPKDAQQALITEFVDYLLNKTNSIIFLDVREGVFNTIKDRYPDKYRPDYEIVWPVMTMDKFDTSLSGRKFKEIRNALSKFNREYSCSVVNAVSVSKNDLHNVVDRWMDNRVRAGIQQLSPDRYHKMITGNFAGTKTARVMLVDGGPVGFNAGWETPNNSNEWSASIGIHDYSVKDLGIALMMEDLAWIKNNGYKICDLEGSDPAALKFKTQFLTQYTTYKTFTFRVKNSGR